MSITQEPCADNTKSEFFFKDVFTTNLRALRGKKSQFSMAHLVGLRSQQQWQRLESGAIEPNLSLLVRLSQLAHKPIGVLLGVEKESEHMATGNILDAMRELRKEMEAGIDRANTFIATIDRIEKKLTAQKSKEE